MVKKILHMTEKRKNRLNAIYFEIKRGLCTKQHLMSLFDMNDERAIRDDIDYIRNFYPVIAVSSMKGYKIPTSKEDIELAKQTIAEAYSRARETIAGVKKLEEWVEEVENG